MRRIQSRGLCAALEEEQVVEAAVAEAAAEAAPAVVDPVEQLEGAESLETELLEVQEVVEEGEVQAEQVEEAAEVQEALGEYQEALEQIAAQGGLDRHGARILHIGLEQLCARVGIVATSKPMPSLESFGGTTSRIRATEIAMESVAEVGKKVWESIIAAIKRAGEWLKGFWKFLTDSNVRLKGRAEKIAAAAKSVSGEAKETEIENGGLAGKLHINGKVEKNFGSDFSEFAKVMEALAGKTIPGVVAYSKKVVELLPKAVQDQESEDIPFRASEVKAAYAGITLSAAEGEGEGLETLKSVQMPGGKAVIVQIPTADGVDGALAFARARTTIGLFKPALAKPTSEKLPVMAAGEVAGVAAAVLEVSKAVDELRAMEKDFDAFVKSLSVGAATFAKQVELANDAGNAKVVAAKKKLQAAKDIFSRLTTRVSNLPGTVGQYALGTAKAALDYSELSLKAYK